MYFLEQMMKSTTRLFQETKSREKALRRMLHVLNIATKQREHTKRTIIRMLNYEENRQRLLLEQRWRHGIISQKQKKEYEKNIQMYEEYVKLLIKQMED